MKLKKSFLFVPSFFILFITVLAFSVPTKVHHIENVDANSNGLVDHNMIEMGGCCSRHKGMDCSRGADKDGSVICRDGWKNSKCTFAKYCTGKKRKSRKSKRKR